MNDYFVARVSTKGQNLARQLAEAKKMGYADENIFTDEISGRKKERPGTKQHRGCDDMKKIIQRGDRVTFTEIDRVARKKSFIREELAWYKERGVIVRILEIPTTMVEFPEGQEWVLEMVNNILIEVLSTIAEQEWEKTKKRREAGVDAMPVDEEGYKISSKTGRRRGRAEKRPDNFDEVYTRQQAGELTLKEALAEVGIGRTRWYELARGEAV